MDPRHLLIFASVFFVFSLVSRRINGTMLTPPMLFTGMGWIAGVSLLPSDRALFDDKTIHTLAELTLVLVLAADASRIRALALYQERAVPIRLLAIALPLIIALGTLAGWLILPGFGLLEAALVAAILAPTDAALGASVLSNPSVPLRIRQSLNAESGLNDGLALPAVLFFACFFNMAQQAGEENWLVFLALQLSLGPIAGICVGYLGGRLIGAASQSGWITEDFQGVAAIALAILAFAGAEAVGGNGFIAAFVCGLTYGNLNVNYSTFLHEFTETESQTLANLTFFLFGLAILPGALAGLSVDVAVYAIASLTVVRMLPVALSMIGTGLRLPTVTFLGWFGPRGLASLLFALLVIEDLDLVFSGRLEDVVSVTVLFSILLHGLTAAPLSARYGAWAKRHTTASCPENLMPGKEPGEGESEKDRDRRIPV